MTDDAYPVDVQVSITEESSRVWALLYILFGLKAFALILHYIVAIVWGVGVLCIFFVSQLVVLFSGRYPEGMHRFVARFIGWSNQLSGWLYGFTDQFPPFTPSDDDYPITTRIPRPGRSSRGWAALAVLLLKSLALIPHFIVLYVLQLVQAILVLVANIIILVNGRFPEGLVDFIVGVLRWQTRVAAFMFGLNDDYPPFSLT